MIIIAKDMPEVYSLDQMVDREKRHIPFGPFWRQRYLNNAPDSVKRHLENSRRFPGNSIFNVMQPFASSADAPPASFAAVGATSTAEVNLWTAMTKWSKIPANDMRAGRRYVVTCGGVVTTNATPTITWTGRIGVSTTPASNTSFGLSTLVASGSGLSAAPWMAELHCIVRSIGIGTAGATLCGMGRADIGNAAAAAAQSAVFGGTIPTTVDDTIDQALMISITFGTSNGSNAFTCQWVHMESKN